MTLEKINKMINRGTATLVLTLIGFTFAFYVFGKMDEKKKPKVSKKRK
ncbi:hypothetical protein KKB40_04025 [Patescibacteria group bacterium]|nr:hypothetical protein [Patescibacteria group bacterium]